MSRPPSRASLWSELAGHHPATTETTCVSPSPAHPRRSRTVPRPHAPTTLTGRSSRGGRGRGGTPRAARHPRRACRPPRSRGRRPCPPTRRRQPADRVGAVAAGHPRGGGGEGGRRARHRTEPAGPPTRGRHPGLCAGDREDHPHIKHVRETRRTRSSPMWAL